MGHTGLDLTEMTEHKFMSFLRENHLGRGLESLLLSFTVYRTFFDWLVVRSECYSRILCSAGSYHSPPGWES